jgi:hypothetical protein
MAEWVCRELALAAVCPPVPEEYGWRTDLAADAKRDPLDLLTDEEWATIWRKVAREEGVRPARIKKPKSPDRVLFLRLSRQCQSKCICQTPKPVY